MSKVITIIFIVVCLDLVSAYIQLEVRRKAFNTELYNDVIDEELCEAQLAFMLDKNKMLLGEFLDAGIRTPRGISKGNFVDLGNYHQCIGIVEQFEQSDIQGKYCMINIPMKQTLSEAFEEVSEFPWPELLPNTRQHKDLMANLEKMQNKTGKCSRYAETSMDIIRVSKESDLSDSFRLAVCLPKTCTTKQFIDTVFVNTTSVGLNFDEEFCRLKGDKPFAPGDYAAFAIFGLIIIITILCTSYDVYFSVILKKDPKKVSPVKKSFSVFTNTRQLVTYKSAHGALECVDGIRVIAIAWIILLHTFSTQGSTPFMNPIDNISWWDSLSAIWVSSSQISVDTFFLLSGLLLVYTSVGKMSRTSLFKNLHLFYLHRLLRMFPVLATAVLLQATLGNHIYDGPEWYIVANEVEWCRTYWWSTLTYLNNYLTSPWCIGPTWYLSVDTQMHFLSPIILFWVLGKKKTAWITLIVGTFSILVASTTYNYLNEFQAGSRVPTRPAEDAVHYTRYYYLNTLTRCSPFFVGMIFGYLLNVYNNKLVHVPKWFLALGWSVAFVVSAAVIYSVYPPRQMDWDSPFWDGIINSFSRPTWAACLGWLIFACTHGYGGPVNWFLSLRMWKLPARISFAMYIFHYPIMIAINASAVSATHFSVMRYVLRFLSDLALTFIVSFLVTVVIESPFSIFVKLAIGGKPRKVNVKKDHEDTKVDDDGKNKTTV